MTSRKLPPALSARVLATFLAGALIVGTIAVVAMWPDEPDDRRASEVVGQSGVPGPAGANGMSGPAGAVGPAGAAGHAGLSGLSGVRGQSGPPGARGDTGAAGTNGNDGVNGTDGNPGVDGTPGSDGAAGPGGAEGPAGTAGANGTPSAITQIWTNSHGIITPETGLLPSKEERTVGEFTVPAGTYLFMYTLGFYNPIFEWPINVDLLTAGSVRCSLVGPSGALVSPPNVRIDPQARQTISGHDSFTVSSTTTVRMRCESIGLWDMKIFQHPMTLMKLDPALVTSS